VIVKHQPAIPLPWRIFEDGGVRHGYTVEISPPEPAELGERPAVVAWSGFDSCGLKASEQQRNAHYITHAANAYPKLVEALHGALSGDPNAAMNADRLLREIGEGR
jgi:hypothetical protein